MLRSEISLLGWFAVIGGGLFCLVAGFYTGQPAEIADSVYEARVVKFEIEHRARRGRNIYSSIYLQGNGKIQPFGYEKSNPRYPDFMRALGMLKRGDRVLVHSVVSNYYPEKMWKLESEEARVVFASSHDETWDQITALNAAGIEATKQRTLFYLAMIVVFIVSQIYGFRKNDADGKIGETVIYRASKGHYWFLMAVSVFVLGQMLYIGALVIGDEKALSHTEDWLKLLFLVGIIGMLALGFMSYRISKTIKHDLVLTREGLHYPDLLRKYGAEFIPWSNMRYCLASKNQFFIYLKQPLNGEDAVEIDTSRLKGTFNLVTDIESAMHGKLFPNTAAE